MKKLLIFVASWVASCTTMLVHAENYPGTRPITIVVPFPAGGPTDRVARDLSVSMAKSLDGATILLNFVPGAAGAIGVAMAAKAPPDGYTLLLNHIGMATIPILVRNLSVNVETDFEYLGLINEVPMTIVSRPDLPPRDFQELAQWISQQKGRVNLGNGGIGSASHLCGLLLQETLHAQMTSIPYKGSGPAMIDLLGGHIDVLCDQTTNTSKQIETRKVKSYAVTSAKRILTPALKDLPTLQELGYEKFEVSIWHGLYAPRGTPPEILKKLNSALRAALKDPRFIEAEEALGAVVVTDKRAEPEGHKRFVAGEISKWGPPIKAAGVYAD